MTMIILHNTYNRIPNEADKLFYNGSPTRSLNKWQLGYSSTNLFKGVNGINGKDLSLAVSMAEMHSLMAFRADNVGAFPGYEDATDFRAVDINTRDMLDIYKRLIFNRLVGFTQHLEDVASYCAAPISKPTKGKVQSLPADNLIYGAAMLSFLVANRQIHNQYNDVVLGGMLSRENTMSYSNGWNEPVCVANGFNPDKDYDYASHYDLAVGLGQRHKAIWHDLGVYLFGSKASKDLTDHDEKYRYGLGRMPWWLQVGMICLDIQRSQMKHDWLRNAPTLSSDPTMITCRYPYFMLGQPGKNQSLWRSPVKKLIGTPYLSRSETWFKKVRAKNGLTTPMNAFSDILIKGVPIEDQNSYLFPVKDDSEWARLVAGLENLGAFATSEGYKVPKTIDIPGLRRFISPESVNNRDSRELTKRFIALTSASSVDTRMTISRDILFE